MLSNPFQIYQAQSARRRREIEKSRYTRAPDGEQEHARQSTNILYTYKARGLLLWG